jgi:hypothetical protein
MSIAHDDRPEPEFDPVYFSSKAWSVRVDDWAAKVDLRFSAGNLEVAKKAITDVDAGLRVVVNIGVTGLLAMLERGRYLNLYERPVIGGQQKKVSPERKAVDRAVGITAPEHTYFGAVALGGVGVRYYGEFCMVLKVDQIDPNPRLFDRDSYDIMIDPLANVDDQSGFVARLSGLWATDVQAMVLMKVLPEVIHDRRLVTIGTISDLVLKDQEFIEVHLMPSQAGLPAGEARSFGPADIEEIRESPDEVAVAARLEQREEAGLRVSAVEHDWLARREDVYRMLGKTSIVTRVVTQHGKGYQWK